MNIFKRLFSRKKNKNQKNLIPQHNEAKNLNGNFYNQNNQSSQNFQDNQNVQNVATYDSNSNIVETTQHFDSTNDSLSNAPSKNFDYESIAKQEYENSKNNINNNNLYNDPNAVTYYDSNKFPFEDKYFERSGNIFYSDNNESRLKKGVDFNTTFSYINGDKNSSIFKSDKLYTLNELKVYKIPLSKTIKVFDNGMVFFKVKESKELTPQEANVYVFKNPYNLFDDILDNNVNIFQKTNGFNSTQNFTNNVSSTPKLLYRISNISYQNQNGVLNNVSFDVFGSQIITVLSVDKLSNFLLGNILKGVYKITQGSIYFNESILTNNYQTKLVNIGNALDNKNSKSNMLKHLSFINYLGLCSIDPTTKVGPAFEIICSFFGVQLNKNLLGNLLQLTNFLKSAQSTIKELQGIELDKFNTILDLLLGRKLIFIESLIANLDNLSKQNLLTYLHNYISVSSTACLLITNNIQDACLFADKFIIIKDGRIIDFTK